MLIHTYASLPYKFFSLHLHSSTNQSSRVELYISKCTSACSILPAVYVIILWALLHVFLLPSGFIILMLPQGYVVHRSYYLDSL